MALVWRDNKFVKMLTTVFVSDGVKKEVQRWDKVSRSHRQARSYNTHHTPTHDIKILLTQTSQVKARLPVPMYQKIMPFVDQGDKNSALFDIFAGRCKRRYHRIPFRWLLSFIGLNNTMVLFNMISPAAPDLEKTWTNNGFGYKVIISTAHI